MRTVILFSSQSDCIHFIPERLSLLISGPCVLLNVTYSSYFVRLSSLRFSGRLLSNHHVLKNCTSTHPRSCSITFSFTHNPHSINHLATCETMCLQGRSGAPGCTTTANGDCFRDDIGNTNYGNDERCTWYVSSSTTLRVHSFQTEIYYDT